MTPEQKEKLIQLVMKIDKASEDCGYYSDPRFDKEFGGKRDAAWEEFKAFLEELP